MLLKAYLACLDQAGGSKVGTVKMRSSVVKHISTVKFSDRLFTTYHLAALLIGSDDSHQD